MLQETSRPPVEMICPLTNELMMQPVVHRTYGYSCEESAIMGWLESGQTLCPLTGQPLEISDFVPHRALQDHIVNWHQAALVAEKEAQQAEEKSLMNDVKESATQDDWKGNRSGNDGSDPVVLALVPRSPPSRRLVTSALVA
ncbi:Putative E3 ubiquitin-protein ligase LIN [Seminavis robusta]|uniref:E3 ubiquitin-protein ligase LIN n=1 Tax=Seminavis robusta TaxID=568900 RepID=A0A9N8EL41_9STRA|nr:Putative E3 ubiquitin-protein ligase LIN [Seminavis robusta]|eukprot:Sro1371_g267060.1 Putative E3 ubiquitin-protein ligase LIN (142) ;mRNA; r:4148-4573